MAKILMCGIPSEPPLAMVARELDSLRQPYLLYNQRESAQADCQFLLNNDGISGTLTVGETTVSLAEIGAVYSRMTDFRLLPELRGADPTSSRYTYFRRLYETIAQWCEIAPGRIVNRLRAGSSNASKPYQAQIIRKYFEIPDTLVTNDPRQVLAFQAEHGQIVYKSISGTRSIVQVFSDQDYGRLPLLGGCPVQFQERVPGVDVRVHTVGWRTFATRIVSDSADYRYARTGGSSTSMEPAALSPGVENACLALAHELGLDFAGIDLKITADGRVYCFEVNPSPAYSAYETSTGQPISRALAQYLAYLD